MLYPITQNFINELPKITYRNGAGKYEGVVCHATACYNDSDESERNFENNTWKNAFVHYFCDEDSITQIADVNYLAWGCGYTGNERYVQIELCQSYDAEKFKQAYARYVWLIAKILHDKNLEVKDGITLLSHKQVSDNWHETTHQDPLDYLASHGVSWGQHVQNVINVYSELVHPSAVLPSFLVKIIAFQLWYYDKPDWDAKKGLVYAGQVFTVIDTLMVNGSKMYKLKSGTYLTANPSFVKVV